MTLSSGRSCFLGKDAIAWLLTQDLPSLAIATFGYELGCDEETALRIGNAMIEMGP